MRRAVIYAGYLGIALYLLPPAAPGQVLSIGSVTVHEPAAGTTNAVFTVTLSPTAAVEVSVSCATADGTATAGTDYVAIATTRLIFPPGSGTQTISVVVNSDAVPEFAEVFFVNLSDPTNATIGTGQGVGTIQDLPDPQYTVTDLGTLGGGYSLARAINDQRQIVGESTEINGETHAFLWQNGVMTNLLNISYVTNSAAYDINAAGHAVGLANGTDGIGRAFLYGTTGFVDLAVATGTASSVARSINESDQVCGQADNYSNDQHHAFLWTAGTTIDIWPLDGMNSSEGYGVDHAGRVIVYSYLYCPSDCYHPFIWWDANSNGVWDRSEMIDMGTLGGSVGQVYGINEIGQVVGASTTDWFTNYHAFVVTPHNGQWDDDNNAGTITNSFMADLGTLGGSNSYAWAVNDSSMIVGSSETSNGVLHAFLYDGISMSDLNLLISPFAGWELNEALDINNSGEIVGYGTVAGETHAFLLTPGFTEVDITGIEPDTNEELGLVQVFWRGVGSNLVYQLEKGPRTDGTNWSPVLPTNQWPTRIPYCSDTNLAGSSPQFYRVKAESVSP